MTPMTTARPTIVRTRPPPASGADLGVVLDEDPKSSLVDSSPAANAVGASSSMPKAAVTADVKAGRSFITEGCAGSRIRADGPVIDRCQRAFNGRDGFRTAARSRPRRPAG